MDWSWIERSSQKTSKRTLWEYWGSSWEIDMGAQDPGAKYVAMPWTILIRLILLGYWYSSQGVPLRPLCLPNWVPLLPNTYLVLPALLTAPHFSSGELRTLLRWALTCKVAGVDLVHNMSRTWVRIRRTYSVRSTLTSIHFIKVSCWFSCSSSSKICSGLCGASPWADRKSVV